MSRRNTTNWSKRGPKPPEVLMIPIMQVVAKQMGVPFHRLDTALRKRADWWLRRTWTTAFNNNSVAWYHKTRDRICGTEERPRSARSWKPLTGDHRQVS